MHVWNIFVSGDGHDRRKQRNTRHDPQSAQSTGDIALEFLGNIEMKRKAGRSKVPRPLAPPPMKSRKRARKVTTAFHKLTKLRDEALKLNNPERVKEIDIELEEMGGFDEYQRASQLNTRLHSTSRWVLKVLSERNLLQGIKDDPIDDALNEESTCCSPSRRDQNASLRNKRLLRILEIGAINTELLDAAEKNKKIQGDKHENGTHTHQSHQIHVRAIDLHSSHPDIEQADFLKIPIDPIGFDAIVCSMVINYVSSPEERGQMLRLIYQQLQPKGLCFLTLPKLCLDQSQFITKESFDELLTEKIGFVVEERKDTPKIYFWVLQRPITSETSMPMEFSCSNNVLPPSRKGKKYRNSFHVIL